MDSTIERHSGQGAVRQVDPPAEARARSTLAHVDYADTFVVETARAQDRTAEQWARATLEAAPEGLRKSLRVAWRALGARLGPTDDARFVLGWPVRQSAPDFVLLGGTSWLGMQAELLLERREDSLLFATFVQHDTPFTRLVWAFVERPHVRVVRHVLEQARRRP
ncbi:MAG TPA: hypothetical protein VG076_06425 [Acidimicrobiales bacterium]|nr:hypothetical protein [Acidimicrobiales bacterium]